jgi:hypothetical protein
MSLPFLNISSRFNTNEVTLAKATIARQAVIEMVFSQPSPEGLDSELLWAVDKLLGNAGECSLSTDFHTTVCLEWGAGLRQHFNPFRR